jgi:MoaA/NifB/PqqE/SkfB family radical SAM enzyme
MNLTEKDIRKMSKLEHDKPMAYAKTLKYDDMLKEGKSIAIVQIQYDYACNFHCSHCSVSDFRTQKKSTLNIHKLHDFALQADEYGLAHLALSGGEPLVFSNLEGIIEALIPEKFHLQMDTNGWFMDQTKALRLKKLGIDKIQLSLDGLDAEQHDAFRKHPGSHSRAVQSIRYILDAGLDLQIATVVDHERATSDELERFMVWCRTMGVPVSVVYAKPVGEWAGKFDKLCTSEDIKHVKKLLAEYGGYDHTTPQYGRELGCIAVKRMIAMTAFGDILPCPWMYFSLGNIFENDLKSILEKGMIYFKDYCPVCRVSESTKFQNEVLSKLPLKGLPKIEEVM